MPPRCAFRHAAIRPHWLIYLLLCLSTGWLLLSPVTSVAHPADEFCADDAGMDPALCRELAELDTVDDEETTSAPSKDKAGNGRRKINKVSLNRPFLETVGLYLRLGFVHILPKGFDHILFVLALFLASLRWRSLLIQISVFTFAHTITLGLAAAGLINISAGVIEPLIALSIAVVAVENIVFKDITKWRPVLIFGFGLFHGLGFASVLKDLGLAQGQFITSLVSFNIGVEFGQLTIIASAFGVSLLARHLVLKTHTQWRQYAVWPISALIAVMGIFWFFTRLFGG